MKILILGATGQLGFDLVRELSHEEVVGYSSKDFDFTSNEEFILNQDFDVVINAMAMTNTGDCEDHKEIAYKLNASRVGEIAKECERIGAKFFHISTDYVFNGLKESEYFEDDKPTPISIYGLSKLAGEYEALMYCSKCFVFRVSSLYGVNGNNFVKAIIKKAKETSEVNIVSDQFMSPTSSHQVAKRVKTFIQNNVLDYGIFNANDDGACSWYEFTQYFLDKAKVDAKLNKVSAADFPSKLKRPIDSRLNVNKMKKYTSVLSWKEAMDMFLEEWSEK